MVMSGFVNVVVVVSLIILLLGMMVMTGTPLVVLPVLMIVVILPLVAFVSVMGSARSAWLGHDHRLQDMDRLLHGLVLDDDRALAVGTPDVLVGIIIVMMIIRTVRAIPGRFHNNDHGFLVIFLLVQTSEELSRVCGK